ncbi:MAG: class I SAM-dependent methyltransferase [Candidatus Hydrogenedentales bacterium]|jgi:SAM-dependent methyltransferase
MLIETRCPLGGDIAFDREVYPANVDLNQLTSDRFSARRLPDRIHYRIVRNLETNTIRSCPILDEESLNRLYRASAVNYEPIADYASRTYLHYAQQALSILKDKRGLLEIGCGHGFFLKAASIFGFDRIAGIEPSSEAVSKAPPELRGLIKEGALQSGLFEPESFSLVCGFQVLDHLAAPNEALQICKSYLAPGGVMLWICHDIASPLARMLGERCPMIDVQHIVLYDRKTVAKLFRRNGYEVCDVFGVSNCYPLSYWMHLMPIPAGIKRMLLPFMDFSSVGAMTLKANLGNLGILARKPL